MGKWRTTTIDLGFAEIEWTEEGVPVLVVAGKWREEEQLRVKVKLGLGGAGELARVLHQVPTRLQERVDSILRGLRGNT